ncbi:chloride channel protein [Thermosulfuriphilus sp.]
MARFSSRRWERQKIRFRGAGRWFILSSLVGILAGLGSIVFHLLIHLGHHYFLDYLTGYLPPYPAGSPELFSPTNRPFNPYMLVLVPALGGLAAGLITSRLCPEAEGHGTDAAIRAYHHEEGRMRARVPLVKTIASFFTLGTGGSGGEEGPITQIGAGWGSFVAQRLKVSPRERRILLAAGMGAGIGSIFRAPLTGALFAAEILYRDTEFEADVLIPSAIASIVAYSVYCMVFGWGAVFAANDYRFESPLQLGPYALTAFVLSGAVGVFVKVFYGFHDFFKRLELPAFLKPAIGGLGAGILGLFIPDVLNFSYGFIQKALYNEVSMGMLFAVGLGKILATALSIGSGGSGGVFGPSIVIGGSIGGGMGWFFHQFMPDIVPDPAPFVIVGMAGFFAGSSNVPVTSVVVVSEITGSYHLLVPSLLVCSLTFYLCRPWNLYREQVPNQVASPAHKGDFFSDILEDIRVRDIFRPERTYAVIPEDMTLRQFVRFFGRTEQHYFPVVDREGKLTGIFSINDVRGFLLDHDLWDLIIMKDIARSDVITTNPLEDINTVLRKFTIRNIDQLPVVSEEDPRTFIGMISRRDVINFYNQRLEEIKRRSLSRSEW